MPTRISLLFDDPLEKGTPVAFAARCTDSRRFANVVSNSHRGTSHPCPRGRQRGTTSGWPKWHLRRAAAEVAALRCCFALEPELTPSLRCKPTGGPTGGLGAEESELAWLHGGYETRCEERRRGRAVIYLDDHCGASGLGEATCCRPRRVPPVD